MHSERRTISIYTNVRARQLGAVRRVCVCMCAYAPRAHRYINTAHTRCLHAYNNIYRTYANTHIRSRANTHARTQIIRPYSQTHTHTHTHINARANVYARARRARRGLGVSQRAPLIRVPASRSYNLRPMLPRVPRWPSCGSIPL